MLEVSLLDGAKKQFDHPVSIIDIARGYAPGSPQKTKQPPFDGNMQWD